MEQDQEQGFLSSLGLVLREVLEVAEILGSHSLYLNKFLKINRGRYLTSLSLSHPKRNQKKNQKKPNSNSIFKHS